MTLIEKIISRAKRILTTFENYHDLSSENLEAKKLRGLVSLDSDEKLIGIYQNNKDFSDNLILITTYGFHILFGAWQFVKFDEIKRVEIPSRKVNVDGFYIELFNGSKVWLPVMGVKNNRFYDAFEFTRFIMRTINDVVACQ